MCLKLDSSVSTFFYLRFAYEEGSLQDNDTKNIRPVKSGMDSKHAKSIAEYSSVIFSCMCLLF